jgi:hypothetical protein
MNALSTWCCLLLSAALGCSAIQTRSTARAHPESGWREYASPHFVVRSDAELEDAQESVRDLETTYEALRAILFASDPGETKPLHVVLFAHGADLHRFLPSGTLAAFIPALPGDPESEPTILVETSLSDEARRVFLHELTHAFIGRTFSRVPLWLNEGLAQYFETMRVEPGRVVVGDPIEGSGIPANQMPSLSALLAADATTFYAGRNAHSVDGMYQQTSYYAGCWYLVHMFMHANENYRTRFLDFLDALKRREPAANAWVRAFDETISRQLAVDYLEYLRADSLAPGFVPLETPTKGEVHTIERLMPAEEVRRLWARLDRGVRR